MAETAARNICVSKPHHYIPPRNQAGAGGSGPIFLECALFITPAYAQAAAPGANDMFMQLLPFVFVLIIMYFLLIRPQQKRAKAHQEMVKNLRRGDTVVMNSGMIGKITKVIDDAEVEVEIADNVRVRLIRGMVAEVRNKSEPVQS
jgi:preprotein translocase subunit YajC